ncbi:IucA/IucC family protein [Methylobacterium haplocladii]|uniref:Siderophore synthetase component n=1 Tax=Methylobacterium haplocladii TaxID=1176176 RepID=A0A512INP8_9HYPH|nr:IucA/IucC family protein [Methylobacterium haplocladii]GEO99315.1 hypothetical protein MHA02_17030 [Methylobacterium haplocladii]GJD83484.1 hypothetical protein HPGCJGGD_1351 [Methylobacterium haplocladii]GLS61085.1 hypothetical protein GCM10007887_37790 [Methylobacterium haplocladii]
MTRALATSDRLDPVAAIHRTHAVERLLNTWLRESPGTVRPQAGETCAIPLGADTLLAPCLRHSPGGFHEWGQPLRLRRPDGRTLPCDDPGDLARRMVDALATDPSPIRETVKRRMLDSLDRSADHIRACAARPADLSPIGLEQSLWHGHPFHPMAKSVDGFSEADTAAYGPERGAAFRLRWILADRDCVGGLWRDPGAEAATHAALVALSGLSPETIGERVVLPSHPWQAARLEADPAFTTLVAEGRLVLTGPSGETVRPTSSVRTVFAPESNLFLKLPIAARITNFARTNSREHLARSIAAARAFAAVPEAVAAAGLDVLSERGALFVDHPQLDAVTGVLVREGPSREAFVVAGLLEPLPRDGRPILADLGCALHAEGAAAWIRAYGRAVLLPALRLFATTGISLEAHAQNSLLAFDAIADGRLPDRLVLRDLEGISIDGRRFAAVAPGLELDPAVYYSADEAWHRLLYYLVVNQASHVVAIVARAADRDEAGLWQVLSQTLAEADEGPATAALVARLLDAETLPAKGNLASCLAGRGERPDYVRLANPLRIPNADSRSDIAADATLQAWNEAGQRVAVQLLGALLHEELLPASVLTLREADNGLSIVITTANGARTYTARARRMWAYGRVLVEAGSLTTAGAAVGDASTFLADLLPHLPGTADDHTRFAEELARTQDNHARALAHGAGKRLRSLDYDSLEGALPDGHRYHPCFKSRIGFSPADNAAYGPEFGADIRPVWIAAHRSIAAGGAIGVANGQDDGLLSQTLDPKTRSAFEARITVRGGASEDFVLLPVHPWQWERLADGASAAARHGGRLIVLGEGPHAYRAQQSIRTLGDSTDPSAPSLKLSLSIRNTSTARTLAPHTVLNAPIVSEWLGEVARDDAFLRMSGTVLLAERMGAAVTLAPSWDRAGSLRGALSAIWRDPVGPHLQGEAAVPFTALTHRDGDAPFIADWIARHGVEPWLDRLLTVAMLPVVHLLVAKGIALESHQQNMVLFHRDGWPTRVALKDFHDGVRFVPDLLKCRRPDLVPTPAEHARVNANSYVEARDVEDVRDFMVDALFGVNLAELGWCLDLWFGFPEARFWERVVAVLADHCAAHPASREGALRYRLAAETVVMEDLARRRLDPAGARGRRVANPLAAPGHRL